MRLYNTVKRSYKPNIEPLIWSFVSVFDSISCVLRVLQSTQNTLEGLSEDQRRKKKK